MYPSTPRNTLKNEYKFGNVCRGGKCWFCCFFIQKLMKISVVKPKSIVINDHNQENVMDVFKKCGGTNFFFY